MTKSLLYIIVLTGMIISLVGKAKKGGINTNTAQNSNAPRQVPKGYQGAEVPKSMQGGTTGSAAIKAKGSLSLLAKTMEDREHDWLARQLAYERAAKGRMSDMFNLKNEHRANCDAGMLRDSHRANCDAEMLRDSHRANCDASGIFYSCGALLAKR